LILPAGFAHWTTFSKLYNTFNGDSMQDAFIPDNALLTVAKSILLAEAGKIVRDIVNSKFAINIHKKLPGYDYCIRK